MPKPTPCNIVNVDLAECNPTDPEKPKHDKSIKEMLGYTCFSPDDTGDFKKWLKKRLEDLDTYGL